MSSKDGREYGIEAVLDTWANAASTSNCAINVEKVWKSGMYEKATSMTF